jgi:non-specific serine/threonine protein kinase
MAGSGTAIPLLSFDTFGDLLKHLRRRLRLTQRELSIAVGYSEAQISRLEQNQRLPDLATIAAVFVPALELENEPEAVARLLELAARAREELPPSGRLTFSRTVARSVTEEFVEEGLAGNLPLKLTSFVGREREIAEVKRLLTPAPASPPLPLSRRTAKRPGEGQGPGVRLVTLTGPGGCGKTRLALAVASELTPHDGVWWIELDALTEPMMAPQAVASTLDIKETPGRGLLGALCESLRAKDAVLVLDNCEHLVESCAHLAASLLRACPKIRLLATSREPLNIPGETTWPVPPLALPDSSLTVSALSNSESVCLFVERAQSVSPGFALRDDNAAAVARICRQLDGMPLAIELAAARTRALSPEQIAARLDDAVGLLKSNSRATPPRHQTLQAALDWSYRLLDPAEKVLLNRLSVFVGGFTLEAVEGIAGDALDLLTALVDKSLVLVKYSGEAARYRLLETVRQYAQARLAEAGDADSIRERHARFYLALAETIEPRLFSSERAIWLERLEQDHANLRAALEWSRSTRNTTFALRLCGALIWFRHFRGYFSEGRTQIENAIQPFSGGSPEFAGEPEQTAWLAKAVWGAGLFAWTQGDFASARARYEVSIRLFRQGQPSENLTHALSNLGLVALSEGNLAEAQALTAEAVALAREGGWDWALALLLYNAGAVIDAQGDEAAARRLLEESRQRFHRIGDQWGQGVSILHLGLMAARRGDEALAQQLVAEALTVSREEGDAWGSVAALALLGQVVQRQGDFSAAVELYSECIALIHDRVDDKATLAIALHGLGSIAWAQAEPKRAVRFFAAALALRDAAGGATPLSLTSREGLEREIAAARAAIEKTEFETAWVEGVSMMATTGM